MRAVRIDRQCAHSITQALHRWWIIIPLRTVHFKCDNLLASVEYGKQDCRRSSNQQRWFQSAMHSLGKCSGYYVNILRANANLVGLGAAVATKCTLQGKRIEMRECPFAVEIWICFGRMSECVSRFGRAARECASSWLDNRASVAFASQLIRSELSWGIDALCAWCSVLRSLLVQC